MHMELNRILTVVLTWNTLFFFFLISVNKKKSLALVDRTICVLAKILKYHYYPEREYFAHTPFPLRGAFVANWHKACGAKIPSARDRS